MKKTPRKSMILSLSISISIFIATLIIVTTNVFEMKTGVVGGFILESSGPQYLVTQIVALVGIILFAVLCYMNREYIKRNASRNLGLTISFFREANPTKNLQFLLGVYLVLSTLNGEFIVHLAYFAANRRILILFAAALALGVCTLLLSGALAGLLRFWDRRGSQGLLVLSSVNMFCTFHRLDIRLGQFLVIFFALLFLSTVILESQLSSKAFEEINHYLVTVPTLSFILFSNCAGDLHLNPFESQSFANFRLLRKGLKPWVDFSMEHGFWEDLGRNILGAFSSGNSDWQISLGVAAFVVPIEWTLLGIALLYLCKRIEHVTFVLMLSFFLIQFGHFSALQMPRILPILAIICVLRNYLESQKPRDLLLLVIVSAIQLIWSPEGIYFVIGVTVVLTIVALRERTKRVWIDLAMYVFMTCGILILVLTPFNLAQSFLYELFVENSGFQFAWGAPFSFSIGFSYWILLLGLPLYFSYSLSIAISNAVHSDIYKKSVSLYSLPLLVGGIIFYIKFLQWPDGHIYQPAAIAIILISVQTFPILRFPKSLQQIEIGLLVLGLASLILSQGTVSQYVPSAVTLETIGSMDASTQSYIARVSHVNETFSKFLPLGRSSTIFDFGNEPETWFDVLGYRTAGGVSKVLNIYSKIAQEKVINNLEKNPPSGVIWGGEFGYWSWPFNGNVMKQYLISAYLLKKYEPVSVDGNYVLLIRKGFFKMDPSAKRVQNSLDCDWMSGSERFNSPVATDPKSFTRRLNLNISAVSQGKEFGKLKTNEADQGFYVSSSMPTDVYISSKSGGKIHFRTTGDGKRHFVWLDQCPVFHNANLDTSWILSTIPNNSDLSIFAK